MARGRAEIERQRRERIAFQRANTPPSETIRRPGSRGQGSGQRVPNPAFAEFRAERNEGGERFVGPVREPETAGPLAPVAPGSTRQPDGSVTRPELQGPVREGETIERRENIPTVAALPGVRPPEVAPPDLGERPLAVGSPRQSVPLTANAGSGRTISTPPRSELREELGLPEGAVQLIKGSRVGFSTAGGTQFAATPSGRFDDALEAANELDPGLAAVRERGFEERRLRVDERGAATSSELARIQGLSEQRLSRRTIHADDGSGRLLTQERNAQGEFVNIPGSPLETALLDPSQSWSVETGDATPEFPLGEKFLLETTSGNTVPLNASNEDIAIEAGIIQLMRERGIQREEARLLVEQEFGL